MKAQQTVHTERIQTAGLDCCCGLDKAGPGTRPVHAIWLLICVDSLGEAEPSDCIETIAFETTQQNCVSERRQNYVQEMRRGQNVQHRWTQLLVAASCCNADRFWHFNFRIS